MYLDYAATTPLLPEVRNEIIKWLDMFGNPSSAYEEGRFVKKKIEECRHNVAEFINGNADNIIFTSSGSAANNLVINGLSDKYLYLYTPTCHKSMRLACESKPFHCKVQMQTNGLIDEEWLIRRINKTKKQKIVFCYEMVNSEIGVCQNNSSISELVKKYNGIVIADATAFVPHFKLNANFASVDFLTFSAHKIGALKGVGVLYYNSSEMLKPLIYGSQEKGLFAGTENVIGIISLGTAVKYWNNYSSSADFLCHFIAEQIDTCIPNSYRIVDINENCIPNIMMFCFPGVRGDELMTLLDEDNYFVSTGSACNVGHEELSSTLLALNIPKEDIPCCIRISLRGDEKMVDILAFLSSLIKNVQKLRMF